MFCNRQMGMVFGSLVARKEHLGMFRLRQMGAISAYIKSLSSTSYMMRSLIVFWHKYAHSDIRT